MAYNLAGVPSAVQVATSQNFISGSAFANLAGGLIDNDRGTELVKRYGSQNLTGLLTFMDAKAPVHSTEFYHYEEDWLHQTFTFSTNVSSGASFSSVGITPVLDGASDSITAKAFVRVNDIIQNELGEQARVTAVTASDTAVTISGVGWGGNFSATTSMQIAVVGNAWGEGTDQPNGITPRVNQYRNYTQIIKESFDATGSAMTEKIWFTVQNADGSTGFLWTFKGERDTYQRFINYKEMQMIVGKAVQGTNGSPYGSEGLEQFARSGNTFQYDIFDLEDVDTIIDQLEEQRGAQENLFIMGQRLKMSFDDAIGNATNFTAGGIQYGAFNGNKEIAINFGFSSYGRAGYTFHSMNYKPFTYPKLLGALGDRYKKAGCIIPVGDYIDPQTRDITPSLRARYKAMPNYSREMESWVTGSAGLATPTNENDGLQVHYRSECAFEGFGNNRFVWVESGAASSGAEGF